MLRTGILAWSVGRSHDSSSNRDYLAGDPGVQQQRVAERVGQSGVASMGQGHMNTPTPVLLRRQLPRDACVSAREECK